MKKITHKTARTCACIMLAASLACAFTALRTGDAYADGTTLSASALLMNAGEETVVSAKNVTLTNDKTDTVTGLSVAHADATQPWSVDINATFSGDTSFTYFLPNQYGSNNQWVANAFTVKNSAGKAVAVFVNANSHWSLLTTGRAYMYDPVQNVYTTARTYYNQTSKVNEYDPTKAPVALTPQTPTLEVPDTEKGGMKEASASLQMPLSGFGDQMYIAPKIGTQVNLENKTLTGDITGTVYFDYDETAKTLAVKTTTYNVGSSITDNQVGKGQTITLGTVSADLSAGYTVSMGSAPAVNVDGTAYSYPYSSSIILTSIDGVDVRGETISSENGDVTAITYAGEKTVNGVPTVYVREGEELGAFTVFGKFKAGGALMSQTSAAIYTVNADQRFAEKTPGTYELTVSAGAYDKKYDVVVQKVYNVGSETVFSTENALIETEQTFASFNGIKITSGGGRKAVLNGLFSDEASVSYVFGSVGGADKPSAGHAWTVTDEKGNSVLSVVQFVKGWQYGDNHTYVYDHATGKYYVPKHGAMPAELSALDLNKAASEGYSYILPLFNRADGKIKCGYETYNIQTSEGTLTFAYDDSAKTLTVKALEVNTTSHDSCSNSSHNEETVHANTYGTLDGDWITLAVISADLSGGYMLQSENSVDTVCAIDSEIGYARDIYVTKVCGVAVGGDTLETVSDGIVSVTLAGGAYSLSETERSKVYIAQGTSLSTMTVTAQKAVTDSWKLPFISNEASITGTFDLTVAGEYPVTLSLTKDGVAYVRDITLVVENSSEIAFDVDGGKALPSIYISEHCYNFQLPTPVRYGWQFLGWYDGETKVTEFAADMASVTLKAKWLDDVAPTVALNDLEYYTIVDKRANFSISAADVIAEDHAWGLLGEQYINIFVKAPQATEYVPLQSFVFDGVTGEYAVRYEVTDGSGNRTQISRVVKYMPTRPVLTVNGEVPQTGYVGIALTLPTATAVSGDTPLNVTVSLVRNGQSVTLTDNAFVPNTAGEYFLSYAVTDDNGLTAQQSFTVQVYADEAAPVITVDTTGITLDDNGVLVIELNDTLVPPTATATDSVSGSLTVSVEVRKGTQTIATGETVLSEAGVYTVVYTAIDGAGNMATAVLDVLVKPEPQPQPPIQPEEKGCGGTVTLSALMGLTTALGAAMYLKKRKNK